MSLEKITNNLSCSYRAICDEFNTEAKGLVILPVYSGCKLSKAGRYFDQQSNGQITLSMQSIAFAGERGQSAHLIETPCGSASSFLLIGCGQRQGIDARRFIIIAETAARALNTTGAKVVTSYMARTMVKRCDTRWRVKRLVEALESQRYKSNALKSRRQTSTANVEIVFSFVKSEQSERAALACKEGLAIAEGMRLARDLGNLPANICTPEYLAQTARDMALRYDSINAEVLDEAQMKTLGMGAILAVSQGSSEPARLITLTYQGGKSSTPPVVLVGKGITFDTGGLSMKSPAGMQDMKFDMCGAASVYGALQACADLALPINVVGVIPAAENMIGPAAVRPGDIITTLSGRTVEITNTDAEGRLVLCDALTYVKRLKPDTVIDIATLTGAMRVALGRHLHGLFSNSRSLAKALDTAGRRSHDRVWEMPLMLEYEHGLKSDYADVVNMAHGSAGAITAACFLAKFTRKLRWAHLDVAATASDASRSGATGRPVSLLVQYLIDRKPT